MSISNRRTIVGLLIVSWLGWGGLGLAAEVPSLDELLKEYRALGLPIPPREAKLVRYQSGGGDRVNGKVKSKVFSLAFQLDAGTKTKDPRLLKGIYEWDSFDRPLQDVAPDLIALKDYLGFQQDDLILAIQCHARGWDKLARRLLERSQQKADKLPNQQKADKPLKKQLLHLAWEYWEGKLTHPKIDRAPVAKRLKELIRVDNELDTPYNRALLKSLELALVPSKAKPGSVEALIDDLVNYSADTETIGVFEVEEHYWRIAKLGFDAVPTLIDHLDDDRLTRAMMGGFNNFPSWHMRVRHVVSDLLEGLAGEAIGRDGFQPLQGHPVAKAEAKKWWDKARKVGEEAYLLAHVLPAEPDEQRDRDISSHLLQLILSKYPRHIPSLYRKVLDKRSLLGSWILANAVLQCKLTAKEKLDLFLNAAKHKDYKHRLPALDAIKNLDRRRFILLLMATIEGLPNDVTGSYWACPEGGLAGLAIESDNPRVWQTLEKVCKRAAVGFRMELLNHFYDPKETRYKVKRLRLLASFLEDATLRDRDSSKQFKGPGAGNQYDKLEVRNFVAMELARLLGIEVELNPDRTSEEWAVIRSRVRGALKHELDKTERRSDP
ncbi:MAG: hypothetical protein HYS12_05410 [Planctomycetes bacterium]|nr:hypothetical protein [Planctomycetota bacterium]